MTSFLSGIRARSDLRHEARRRREHRPVVERHLQRGNDHRGPEQHELALRADRRADLQGSPRSEPRGRRSDALQSGRVPPAAAERHGRQPRQRADRRAAASGYSNWDFTLSRRVQTRLARERAAAAPGVQPLQPGGVHRAERGLLVRGDGANTSPDTGKYTTTTNPRNVGLTLRFDF